MSHWKAELSLRVEPEGSLSNFRGETGPEVSPINVIFLVSNLSGASHHPHTLLSILFFFPLLSSTWLWSVWQNILVNCWHFSLPEFFTSIIWLCSSCVLTISVIQCWQCNFSLLTFNLCWNVGVGDVLTYVPPDVWAEFSVCHMGAHKHEP